MAFYEAASTQVLLAQCFHPVWAGKHSHAFLGLLLLGSAGLNPSSPPWDGASPIGVHQRAV